MARTTSMMHLRVSQPIIGENVTPGLKFDLMFTIATSRLDMNTLQVNTKFVNHLPEWSRFVTRVKQARNLHEVSFDQMYEYLKQNEPDANEVHEMKSIFPDPLTLIANIYNPSLSYSSYKNIGKWMVLQCMQLPNDLLTDVIKETHTYKDYVAENEGESSTPRPSLKIIIKQKKTTLIVPLPPSDDRERDDIIKATQLSLAEAKAVKVYEEQQNVTAVEKRIVEEDVEKLIDGEYESSSSEFAGTMLLSDEDSDDRIEPESHKENPEAIVDDDEERK
ncbi:hypothetical protein Tco_0260092 [Tanacetum coccineum]